MDLSGLTDSPVAQNFQQSNWQKLQLNTDLLKQGQGYLYRNGGIIKTAWNEEFIKMRFLIQAGFLIKGRVNQ